MVSHTSIAVRKNVIDIWLIHKILWGEKARLETMAILWYASFMFKYVLLAKMFSGKLPKLIVIISGGGGMREILHRESLVFRGV